LPAAAALLPLFVAGVVEEDAAHGLGCGGEEVAAAIPGVCHLAADQAEVGLVDQGGGLQGLPRLLLGQLLRGEPAQLVIDKGEQLLGGVRVALVDGGQEVGDLTHGGLPGVAVSWDGEHCSTARSGCRGGSSWNVCRWHSYRRVWGGGVTKRILSRCRVRRVP